MEIREALKEDAVAACNVLRRSILDLCVLDHGNDPVLLDQWLANKTPQIVASWITDPNNSVFVAVAAGVIVGVGSVTNAGYVGLNYVSPDARFRGVSRAMMETLEHRARERGHTRCSLVSTVTARRFYRACSYVETGPPVFNWGMLSYRMAKDLDPIRPTP